MRKDELIRMGWEKQSTHDEPRLSEVVKMYKELDFDVHLEPFHPEEIKECTECMKVSSEKYKTIYTRKKRDKDKNG